MQFTFVRVVRRLASLFNGGCATNHQKTTHRFAGSGHERGYLLEQREMTGSDSAYSCEIALSDIAPDTGELGEKADDLEFFVRGAVSRSSG